MAMHEIHKGEAILYDGCPRCDEHAMNPFNSLDDENFDKLVKRIEDRRDGFMDGTLNEYLAITNIKRAMNQANRIREATDRIRAGLVR